MAVMVGEMVTMNPETIVEHAKNLYYRFSQDLCRHMVWGYCRGLIAYPLKPEKKL